MLIHGDNLLSLKALEKKSGEQVKCIYLTLTLQADIERAFLQWIPKKR